MVLRVILQFMDRLSSPKYYKHRSEAEVHIIFSGDRPVHKLPFGQKCHELFVILYTTDQKLLQSEHNWMHYMNTFNTHSNTHVHRTNVSLSITIEV